MRLLVDISAHGWGHLSQTAMIIKALQQRGPVDLVIRSGLDRDLIRERIGGPFQYHPSVTDFGLVMANPFLVDAAATLRRYAEVHSNLTSRVDEIANIVSREGCDAVLANVGYLALAAATRARVPGIACSSLNWSDLFAYYCGGLAGAEKIQGEIDQAYREASTFLRLLPGMPMDGFSTQPVDRTLARVGSRRREELVALMSARSPIILFAFGGMVPDDPPAWLGSTKKFTVLGPPSWSTLGVVSAESTGMPFDDLIASVDCVVTKPGYGIISELGSAGTSAILVSRDGWPEERYLVSWLRRRVRCTVVPSLTGILENLVSNHLGAALKRRADIAASGGEELVAHRIIEAIWKR